MGGPVSTFTTIWGTTIVVGVPIVAEEQKYHYYYHHLPTYLLKLSNIIANSDCRITSVLLKQ